MQIVRVSSREARTPHQYFDAVLLLLNVLFIFSLAQANDPLLRRHTCSVNGTRKTAMYSSGQRIPVEVDISKQY